MSKSGRNNAKHITIVFLGTFVVAAVIDLGSELLIRRVQSLVLALLFLLFIILLHIVFDIIAVAAMSGSEAPFHAKAANKVKGAAHAVKLVRNADLVANFCADVVGDVTGTISGALAAGIVLDILRLLPGLTAFEIIIGGLFLALVASITVSGKAWGKSFGVKRANDVIFLVGKILSSIETTTGFSFIETGKKRKRGIKA